MGVTVLEDRGQQRGRHEAKHDWFTANGVALMQVPLPVGDYILLTDSVQDVIRRKEARGIAIKKMDFLGSYHTSVDTKKDMQEIIGNICGPQHERFRDELILGKNNGIKLYVLIENRDGVKSIDDLDTWVNPRANMFGWVTAPNGARKKVLKYPDATKGTTLAKAMRTMQEKYGVTFLFSSPEEAGKRVVELLTRGQEG